MKKTGWLIATLLCMVLTGVTVYLASSFKTTEQKAAEAAAPPASTLTATVERKVLESTLALTCTVDYSQKRELTVTNASGGAQFTSIDVTKGERLANGSLVAEINGQPVFTIIGGFSFYRDLSLEDRGPDAQLLNDALVAMGYQRARIGADRDTIDAETYRALNRLHTYFGYPGISQEDPINASQFIVLPDEVEVISDPRRTGDVSAGAIATLSSGEREVACKPTVGTLTDDIVDGQQVRLPDLGTESYSVTVAQKDTSSSDTENAAGTVANDQDKRYLAVSVGADAVEGKTRLNGEIILATSGEPGLVVPSSALFTTANGTQVTVVDRDGSERVETVIVDFSANGYSTVSSANGNLVEGDAVRISQER